MNKMRVRVIGCALLIYILPLQCNVRIVVTDYMLSVVPTFNFGCITRTPGGLSRTRFAAVADLKSGLAGRRFLGCLLVGWMACGVDLLQAKTMVIVLVKALLKPCT